MKIIHITNYFQPQLGYQEYFLAKEHAKLGHEVTVLTSERYFPSPDYNNTTAPILGNRIFKPQKRIYENFTIINLPILFEISYRVWLRGLEHHIKEINPDLIICHGIGNFNTLRVAKLKSRYNFRLLVDDHMLHREVKNSLAAKIFYKFFDFDTILKNSDRVIGVADECVKFIVEQYKYPSHRVEMIPLGADTELFRFDRDKRTDFRKQHLIDENAIVLTYTGKHTLSKGPHHIFLALKQLGTKLKGQNVVFLSVGNIDSSYAPTFNAFAKEITGIARFLQLPAVSIKNLVDVYSASDFAVWPRQVTISMIEAASCGIAIVGCNFLKERFKYNNGLTVEEDNIEELSSALEQLILNKQMRVDMGNNGRLYVESELSWKKVAEQFLDS